MRQLSVSLMDAAGHVWSTSDTNVPIAAQANVSRQRRFTLPVPPTTPPGKYRLALNVVDVASGNLLHIRATDDRTLGGIDWPFGTITIDPIQTAIDPATRIPPITLNVDLGQCDPRHRFRRAALSGDQRRSVDVVDGVAGAD